jgi:methyl-accepting chemotaxis protein
MTLTIFVALTTVAVLIQACILIAMFVSLRKTSARVETLAEEVRTKVLPVAETTQRMLLELRPRIETTVANVADTSAMVRKQMERLDATISDIIDRARLQVIRADDLVSRTLDRVEETTDMVHKTVVSPVRQMSGLLRGLTVGLEYLVGSNRRHRDVGVPQDEMFI